MDKLINECKAVDEDGDTEGCCSGALLLSGAALDLVQDLKLFKF